MNKLIKQQLSEVKATSIEYSNDTVSIFIPKTIKILTQAVKVGSVYIIELHSNITNPSEGSTLASNWNKGIIPKHSKYIVEIVENMAKMIRVNGVAIEDNSDRFMGWLPQDSFEIIAKV